jgi:isocitrate dehydrogenase (NAD+)
MPHVVTLVPGDGIGPEITAAVVQILRAAEAPIQWERHDAGAQTLADVGHVLPPPLLESIKRNKVALKGPITTPVGGGFRSANVELRKALNLYANLRPVTNLPGVTSRCSGVDLVIVRENTEDLYSGLEHEVVPGVVESLKVITAEASRNIAGFAFDYASRHRRKLVTAVHKANIMKQSDGLFLKAVREVAAFHPAIAYEERIVDAACMHLVMHPERFDVMVMPNLYGDILSDLCAGLVGGLGVVSGANLGPTAAVFEAVHGSAPDIAGRNVANPTALLLSAVQLLRHLGEHATAGAVQAALECVLLSGTRTPDLGGTASTTEFAAAICREIEGRTERQQSATNGITVISG